MSLRLDFCSRGAATFAVKAWHYSRSMPAGRLVTIGAWEHETFIGAIVFGRGASSEIHSPFGLQQSEVCELCRVALRPHQGPTSQVVALAVRLLRRQSPGLRLIVSYADPEHQHVGVLYQALSFMFIGCTNAESLIQLNGRLFHPRTVASRYRTRSIDWLRLHVAADAGHRRTSPKFKYVRPLDPAMRQQLAPRVQPYPKVVCGRSAGQRHARALAGLPSPRPSGDNHREGALRYDPVAPLVHEVAHV